MMSTLKGTSTTLSSPDENQRLQIIIHNLGSKFGLCSCKKVKPPVRLSVSLKPIRGFWPGTGLASAVDQEPLGERSWDASNFDRQRGKMETKPSANAKLLTMAGRRETKIDKLKSYETRINAARFFPSSLFQGLVQESWLRLVETP